jgi:hypothetical protein
MATVCPPPASLLRVRTYGSSTSYPLPRSLAT